MDVEDVGALAVAIGSLIVVGLFIFGLFSIKDEESTKADQREWIEHNIEENYLVSEVEASFDEGIPKSDDKKKRFFEIEGFSDDLHDRVATKGYLDFDEQVVIIGDDVDGVFVPVEGSDAARLLADPAGVS